MACVMFDASVINNEKILGNKLPFQMNTLNFKTF